MADTVLDPTQQETVEMPNGVVLTGAGDHDADALREQFEERHEALTGQPAEPAQQPTDQPRKTRGQKRFDELTAEREAANRRAEAAEAKARELEAKLQQGAQPKVEQAQPPAEGAAPRVVPPTRPKPTETEIGTKYLSLTDYFEDLADWKAEQREAQLLSQFDARLQNSIEADRASRSRTERANQVFDAGRSVYTDFDAVLAKVDSILIPPAYQDAILKMPNAEHVMYALASNPDALKALIAERDPVMVGHRLATAASRPEAVASPASTPVAVRTTNAPLPPQPVGAGTRTAQPSLNDLANSGNFEAYKARRAAGATT